MSEAAHSHEAICPPRHQAEATTPNGPEGPFLNPKPEHTQPDLQIVPEKPDVTVEDILPKIDMYKFVQEPGSIVRINRQQRIRQAVHIYTSLTDIEVSPRERDAQLHKAKLHLDATLKFKGVELKRQEVLDVQAAEEATYQDKKEQGELLPTLIDAIEAKANQELPETDMQELRSDLLRLFYWDDIKSRLATELKIKKKIAPGLINLLSRILP
jgi:hypothetical protein